MKTNLMKSAFLAISFLCAGGSAVAQAVHANIPFQFFANGKSMPAGIYTVRPLPGSSSLLLFVNEATGEKALAFARVGPGSTVRGADGVTIRATERTYELSNIPNRSVAPIALTLTK